MVIKLFIKLVRSVLVLVLYCRYMCYIDYWFQDLQKKKNPVRIGQQLY